MLFTIGVGNAWGTEYELVTSTSGLVAGAHYIIGNGSSGSVKFMSTANIANYRGETSAQTVTNNKVTATNDMLVLTLGGSTGAWTLYTYNYAGTAGYLASAASGNNSYCRVIDTAPTGTITFSSNQAIINLGPHASRTKLQHNSSATRFACYSSNQGAIYLYKEVTGGGSTPTITTSSSMTTLTYSGGSPVAQSFTIGGSNLTNTVRVTAPTDYQVSKSSGSGYANYIEFTNTEVNAADKTVYIRLQSGLSAGNIASRNITVASSGADDKTIAITGSVPYTITWMANGNLHATTYVAVGSTLALPATNPVPNSCGCTGKAFFGWYGLGTSYKHASNAPSIAAAGDAVSADKTYYAVFADAEEGDPVYTKVTSITAGTYVMVSEKTASTYRYMPNTTSSSTNPTLGSGITMSTTAGVTTLTNAVTDAMLWDISTGETSGYFYVRPHGSTTIGLGTTNSTGGNIRISTTYVNTEWRFTTSASYGWEIYNGSMYLAVYADNAWRNYSNNSTNQNGTFYMFKQSGGTTYSNYDTSCCTPLGSITGNIGTNTPTSVTLTWSAVSGAEKYQVKVPGSSSHNSWTDAVSGVSVTKSCGTAYTAYFRAIDTNGSHCSEGPESTLAIPAVSWTVTSTGVTNATASPAIPSTTCASGFSTTISAATGYALPAEITVTNASKTWNSSTGALSISSVTGNVSITITPTCVPPVVTGDPADADYYVGDSPTPLSVTATLASGTRTYLWKVSTNGGSTWSDAAGTNNEATYSGASLSTASAGTIKFKCIVGNSQGGCTVESAVATITVSNASYFPNGKTIFIQAESTSAWTGGGCVKAWFHTAGGSETAQSTYWLFDATGGDAGKKLFATVVPATGDLPYLDIQRFAANCSDWWNKNGGCSYSDANGSNTIRSTGKHDDSSDGDYIRWNVSGVTIDLHGDPSGDEWASSLASFSDQGAGVWTATYNNYAPANAAGESQDFKAKTNYNGWIGNTGNNDNATLDGMHVGSTYNITATLDVTDHSLVMSKEFVKGTVHFDLQGHGLAISDLENVAAGSKISAPSEPSATGYTFGGWYKEPACTNAWNFGSDVVNETMTLYAKWTIKSHTLTWNWDGGSTTSTSYTLYPATSGSVNYNAAITKPANGTMSKTGYTFSSWSSNATTMPDEDLTITAQWTAKTTSITLNKNNEDASGSTAGSASWTYDQTTKNSITAATRTGYNVDGYYTAASDGTKILNADGSLAGDNITVSTTVYTNGGKWAYDGTELTLYAHWTLKTTTISFNQNSGTGGQTTTKTATYSQAMPTPITTPTRAGYTFTGYFENSGGTGTKYYNADGSSATNWNKENSTWTLYAGWTAKEDTYKTALHTGASGWTSYASGVTKSGAGYTIPAPSSVSKGATSSCEDTHYHFAGWVADEYKGSPSGHIIAASGTTDATGATYWAVWEKEKAGSAGAVVNTVLFSENWTGVENNTTPSSPSESGSEVYNDATVTYNWEDGGTTTQTYTSGGPNSNENILISKSNGSWTASGIPVGGAATITYTYAKSGSGVLAVSTTTANVTVGGNSSGSTITISGNVSTFDLKFENTATGNNNLRLDDIVVKVATQGVSYEDPKAVCEACVATPSISGVSLMGTAFTTTSVPVQATGASAGDNCSLASYGFYWGASADPSTNNTASNNLSTGTFSATLTGPFEIGTTYHYRAYGTNEASNTGYSSDATFTLHNVTFNMHSHGGDAPAAQVVPEGGKATNPGNPSEVGYTFDGWWANSTYTGSAWDFSTNTVGSGDLVLHAKWTEKPKYTITLNAGNGTVTADGWTAGDSPTWSKTQANGDEEITLPSASCNCAGWEFQGWAASSVDQAGEPTMTSSGTSVLPGSNTIYYAVYRENSTGGTTYNKITSTGDLTTGDYLFVADGGYAMQNTVNGKRMDEVSGFTSSNPSQTTDNTSLVWTIAKFNSQVVIKNGSNYLGIDADNTICMTTTPHFFTYTYNAGSSRWEFTSVTKTSYQLTYSTAAGTSYSYFCAGTSQSTAIYLYKQGDGLTGNYKTNPSCSDITVTGAVSPAGSGTVTLTAGSGKSGDKVYAMYTPDEDYNFNNWSIEGTGSSLGSTTAVVTEITIGSENTTVTANFVAKDWKTVTWKADGVALTGDGLGSASVKVENGFDITALPPAPAPCDDASTTFMGWVEDGDVWSGKTDDVSGVTIYTKASDFPTVTDNVTYHAVWAKRNGSAAPATYAGTGVFTKITTMEELEVGAHYVLYGTKDDDASVKGAMNNTFTVEASGKNVFGASAVTISDNKITNPATTIVWKLGGTTNAYTLYSQNSSKYVEITANDTRGYTNPSSPTTSFTITVSEGNFKIITNYASANNRMITIYTASVFRSYASNTEGYTLNLYKYGNDYTYNQYLVKCCEDPELAFDGEYNYQTLVRQDIHGARGGNGSATAEQGKATLVLDYSTESGGTCTVEVKKLTGGDNRSTAAAGSSCANHTGIAINESTKKVTFDVWTYAGSYPTANGQGTYRIKITQEATSTYCAAETYYFVDVILRDKFVDAVNGNATINVDGQSKSTTDFYKTPTEASLDGDKNDDCHSTTRRFLGWVREDNMDTWYGSSSDRTRDLDDKKDDAALVAPNADIITSGSTWYAIWGIEE